MEIRKIRSTQIILYKYEEIPFQILLNKKNMDKLAKFFNFNRAEILQDSITSEPKVINFSEGLFTYGDNQIVNIENLKIEERKISLRIGGGIELLKEIYISLVSFINFHNNEQKELEPIVISNESELIAKLDIPFNYLFNETFVSLIDEDFSSMINSDIADSSINLGSISFVVSYFPKDKKLDDYKISLSRKDLVIGMARGYPPEDRMYFIGAPIDSLMLETFVRSFEKKFEKQSLKK